MQTVAPSLRSRRLVVALGAVFLGGGCAPAGVVGTAHVVASAGTSTSATVVTPFVESETPSGALDRIDQRALPLDHTYKHYGTGRGVTVYVFDGGILDSHPELAGRVRHGYDAFADDERLCNAHGTAVAGAIAGTTLGVAPDADIVDVKMVDCRKMRGTIDAIVRGAHWVIADHAQHPDRRAIANWSFIADTSTAMPALDSAVAKLLAAGIPVIVSAGNFDMNACRISPANSPGTIVVGASRMRPTADTANAPLADDRTPGTAYGNCIDVFAPGESVLLPSMDWQQKPTQQIWTGTSMAAGYVSGAVALFLEAHPFATPTEVTSHIKESASTAAIDSRSPSVGLLFVGSAPKR